MASATQAVQLRASLVWRDEVMADVVLDRPGALTLGSAAGCTFVIPDLGLPPRFPIIKPGNRGYLLTLGARMRGTIAVDGSQRDVQEFVRRGGEGGEGGEAASSFRATPIGGRDWGVIDLDERGDHKLFFQFVPVEAPLPRPRFGRYREVFAVAALILGGALAFPSYATVIVLASMLGTALFEIVAGFITAEDDDFTRPAIAFSILLFALLLGVAFKFRSKENPWLPPGPRELTAGYLVDRLQIEPPEPPPPPPAKTSGPKADAAAASTAGEKERSKAATKRDEGKSGGEGKQRAMDPDADDTPPPPPDKGLMTGSNRKEIDRVRQLDNLPALVAYTGLKGDKQDGDAGMGHGTGTGVGDDAGGTGTKKGSRGHGRGGGGSADADFESGKDVDVKAHDAPKGAGGTGSGVQRAKVELTGSNGDFSGGLSREDVDRVVKSRKGTIQACYQRVVQRKAGLAGKLVVSFTIDAAGKVVSTRVDHGKSSLADGDVESCVKREIQGMSFPAKGGAIVNYPFIFSSG